MDWSDLQFFLAVAKNGNIRRAAKWLKVNHSTVSRRINAFEEQVGLRLFNRESSGYTLTSAGIDMLASVERIESEVLTLDREVLGKNVQLHGDLRVTMPIAFAIYLMAPILTTFSQAYTEIELDLTISNKNLSLTRREADVAMRITDQPPEHLVGRKIITYRKSVYASQEYLKRFRNNPESMRWIGWGDNHPTPWWVKESAFKENQLQHTINNENLQLEMAKAGAGMTMLPCFMADTVPQLRRVPPGNLLPSHDIWLLTHRDLRHTARVKVFMQFIYEELEQRKALLLGEQQ